MAENASMYGGGPLVVSELRTNAVLSLFKIMVNKGKQRMELQEHLNYLKNLKIKTDLVRRQTGVY